MHNKFIPVIFVLIMVVTTFTPLLNTTAVAQSKQEIGKDVGVLEATATHSSAYREGLRVMGTGTDDYYVYTDWTPGVETTSGVDGYIDTNGNLGDPGAEYIIFAGGASEWGTQTAYIYKVETAGDPNMHPDNPDDPGPVAPRTFTLVSSHDLGEIYGHTNAFYIDDTGIYYGPRYKKDGTYGGIYHWDFDWTPISWEVSTAPPEGGNANQWTGAQTLARNPSTGDWWTGLEDRKLYKWDGSSWAYQFTHPSLGGGHHDGLEIIGDSLFVSDMTSDVIAQYRLDTSGNVIDPPDDPYKTITYTTPGDVEGMGYGPNKHIWIAGWSSSTIYEIGSGELLEGISLSATPDKLEYTANEVVKLDVTVTDIEGNPLYPLVESNFKVFVDGTEVNIEDLKRISATDYEIKIKAPQAVGDHTIVVRADTVFGWGSDIVEIKVYHVSSVSLTIGGNRLTRYENSTDTPVYYRADSDVYPEFEIAVELNGATLSEVKDDIQVSVNISDFTGVKSPVSKEAVYRSDASKYRAEWKDSTDEYPVGKYNATAEVKDLNDNLLASSDKKHFYLIFKPPAGYEDFIDTTHSSEIHSHNGLPCPDNSHTAAFDGTKFYHLHQFEYRNWKPVLNNITGNLTVDEAAKTLLLFAHGIDGSYYGYWHSQMDERSDYSWKNDPTHKHGARVCGNFGWTRDYAAVDRWGNKWENANKFDRGPNAWWYDVNTFLDSDFRPNDPNGNCPRQRPMGVCADYAPLLISNARSAGIPAREIGGFFATPGGHAVTEVYYNNEWHHYDPTWNEYDSPWTYSDQGYYWKQYLTKQNSPECSSHITDRKDLYNYIAETVDISFDKEDYDYPDPMTITFTTNNTGHIPIRSNELHIRVYDKPTIARLGPAHLIDHVRVEASEANPVPVGGTREDSADYQLPDYGLLNSFYELIGDRYIIAQIHYYITWIDQNGFHEDYYLIPNVKYEEKIPGLCSECNPQIVVDNSTITLNTANTTSFYFNDTTNESTETFVKPQNASVTGEHKIKCYTNYTRENWYLFNPNNNTHNYSLMTPLLGIGNAVYISGYGSITANQSVDTSADYIVIYNTSVGTNGSVDIYAFSKNMTLKEITLFNGIVKITGMQNCTFAQESGESYLTYLSTRNGSGMSFIGIYDNFAQEIVSNGGTLTQFFIEGEHEQISYYKVGDTVYVNTTISNNGIFGETRNLSLMITEPGIWGSENIIYNTTETVIIPAKSEADVTFQYQIPDNPQIGRHRIIVSDDVTKATTIFMIQAPFNVTFDVPATVAQAEEFYVNATITNALDISLSGINVTIELPNDFNTSENLTKNIGTLLSGESAGVSWLVNATDFEYGYAPITIYITSAEGINDTATTTLTVLRLPELKFFPSAPPEAQINISFEFMANVTNEGNLNLSGVSVNLSLPDNVTTTDNLTKLIGDLAGGETKSVNWTITSMRENDFWIEVNGRDVSGTYCAYATELINIVKPEIELNLVNPVEVIINQSFSAIAKIKNIGELNASQVKVNLSLPPEFETVNDTFVNIGNLSIGQTKEVEWTLQGVNPGYGEITVNVTLSGDVSITKGVIVTYFPLSAETDKNIYMRGDNVKITSNTTNKNPEVSYVDLVMNLTIQGPNIAETYDRPIPYIRSLESLNVTFTWDTTEKPLGDYIVTTRIMGSPRVISEASTSFTIELLETDLPNVELISADPTVTSINVTSSNLSEINETHKPKGVTPQSAYMINSSGAGNFTLRFTNITNANMTTAYKIDPLSVPPNKWVGLDTTTTATNVTFTMSVGDLPVVFGVNVTVKVAFDETHGELFSIDPDSKYSYSKFASILEDRGYEVKTLNSSPITSEKLNNCSIFVIPAPTKPFDTSEIVAIQEFVSNGGNLLLINEWGGDFRQGSNLNDLSKSFGVVFNNDTVNDPTNNFHNTPSYVLIHEFSGHYITKDVNEFLYPAGCSLVANNSIAWADDDSYTTLPNIPLVSKAEKEPGDITVLAATNFERGRVVCIGDGDFCDDLDIDGNGRANIEEYDNKKLALNIMEWLSCGAINEPPVASFTYCPENPVVNQTITFNASSSYDPDGTIENYEWDFGDGTNGGGEIVNYSYCAAGNYTVNLTVTDNEGAIDTETKNVIVSDGKIIYVDDNFIDDPANHKWNTIQKGINDANDGDTIIVRDGIYNENIDVNKPHLTIKSENGSANCIVQAANSSDHVFEVTADYVNISGFTVEGATEEAGINLHGVDHCIISDNNVLNNEGGIYLYSSNNNVITNNNVNSNDFGIWLIFSSFLNTIANNNASNSSLAIFLTYSDNNMITKNNVSNNKYGIWHIHSNNSMITENIISNSNYGGLWLDSSNNNTIYLNNFINNTNNIYSSESTNTWNSAEKITYKYNGETYENYLGNYWEGYNGSDVDSDGIGDTPYNVNSDKDHYPLMQPWENYFGVYKTGLKITITSDKEEYPPGDHVLITMKLKNEGEEPVLITNPITTTFIAEDGSIVLEEDLSYSISVTLGKGVQWSFGTSYKLPEDAPEGYYDVTVSFSGGNYVKITEDLFYVGYPI